MKKVALALSLPRTRYPPWTACLPPQTTHPPPHFTRDAAREALQELSEWRGRVGAQVEGHRAELAQLQARLTSDMGGLRGELATIKAHIRRQLAQQQPSGGGAVAAAEAPAT